MKNKLLTAALLVATTALLSSSYLLYEYHEQDTRIWRTQCAVVPAAASAIVERYARERCHSHSYSINDFEIVSWGLEKCVYQCQLSLPKEIELFFDYLEMCFKFQFGIMGIKKDLTVKRIDREYTDDEYNTYLLELTIFR